MHGYEELATGRRGAHVPGRKDVRRPVGNRFLGTFDKTDPRERTEIIEAVVARAVIDDDDLQIVFPRVLADRAQADRHHVAYLPMGYAHADARRVQVRDFHARALSLQIQRKSPVT